MYRPDVWDLDSDWYLHNPDWAWYRGRLESIELCERQRWNARRRLNFATAFLPITRLLPLPSAAPCASLQLELLPAGLARVLGARIETATNSQLQWWYQAQVDCECRMERVQLGNLQLRKTSMVALPKMTDQPEHGRPSVSTEAAAASMLGSPRAGGGGGAEQQLAEKLAKLQATLDSQNLVKMRAVLTAHWGKAVPDPVQVSINSPCSTTWTVLHHDGPDHHVACPPS